MTQTIVELQKYNFYMWIQRRWLRFSTPKDTGTPDGRSLAIKIRRLLDIDWEVVVNHIYQEANQCADALTNLRGSLEASLVLFDVCPPQFSHMLAADVLGITIPRLVHLYFSFPGLRPSM